MRNPDDVVIKAIHHIFDLFDVPKENVKEFSNEDGFIFTVLDIIQLLFQETPDIPQFDRVLNKAMNKGLSKEKVYSYEISWIIRGITPDIWTERLQQLGRTAASTVVESDTSWFRNVNWRIS